MLKPSKVARQNRIREVLARWRSSNPRPGLGDYFEQDGQRWSVVGFEHRHLPNKASELIALVLESQCRVCSAQFVISLPHGKLSPSPNCQACAKAWNESKGAMLPKALPAKLRTLLEELAILRSSITSEDFAALALPLVPGKRKTQKLGDALRRMERRGQFPEGVTLTPVGFTFM